MNRLTNQNRAKATNATALLKSALHSAHENGATMGMQVSGQPQRWRDGLVNGLIVGGIIANIVWIGAGVYVLVLGMNGIIGLLG